MHNFVKNKRTFFYTAAIAFLLVSVTVCKAQEKDSLVLKTNNVHSPKKAALLSAVFPGLGQAYNKKYWKMPIIYLGGAALGYSIGFNHSQYVKYRDAYKYRLEGKTDDFIDVYTDADLNYLQKSYNRYRDLSVIGASLLYILNIIDASVDAHLLTFDVSDDLSLRFQPLIFGAAFENQHNAGFTLTMNF